MTLYELGQRIPDYIFPGGISAYEARAGECTARLGYAFQCWDLFWWREAFHLFGGIILFWVFGLFYKNKIAKMICYGFILYLCIQELYLHPVFYGQVWWKTIADLVFWLAPISIAYYRVFLKTIRNHIILPLIQAHTMAAEYIRTYIVGLIATLCDVLSYTLFYYVFGVPVEYAVVASASVGGLVCFLLNDSFGFASHLHGEKLAYEGLRFFLVWLVSMFANTFLTAFLVGYMPAIWSRIVSVLIIGNIWNFVMFKNFVFVRKPKFVKK